MVDDDGETIAVLGAGRTSALSASTLAWQAEVWKLCTALCLLERKGPFVFLQPSLCTSERIMGVWTGWSRAIGTHMESAVHRLKGYGGMSKSGQKLGL